MPGWLMLLLAFAAYLTLMRCGLPAIGHSNMNVPIVRCRVSARFRSDSEIIPFSLWCRRGDSNPHGFPHHPLKMACLPVPPLRHSSRLTPSVYLAGLGGSAGLELGCFF